VYRVALRVTRNAEDAKDVQQETMLKVHRKLGQFEGRSDLSLWVCKIAVNESLMLLRKRHVRAHLSLEEAILSCEEAVATGHLQSTIEGPDAAYVRKEMGGVLKRAIANLHPAHRVTFVLRHVEELSTIETAKALHISISAVKRRLSLARKQLQGCLRNVVSPIVR
jgi:RNA polymerase sigma-70 factor (ECF subfamily)